jgi:predicted transcriptional regulator YdeE
MRKHFSDGAVERLKEVSGSEDVYMLFCYTCERDDENKCYVCSYDIACENLNGSGSNEFSTVGLNDCEYAVYDCEFDNETALQDAHEPTDELFWGDTGWLKNSGYICAIDDPENWAGKGYAQIERYTPFDIDAKRYQMQIWYPILPKDK